MTARTDGIGPCCSKHRLVTLDYVDGEDRWADMFNALDEDEGKKAIEMIRKYVATAVAEEREACAKICSDRAQSYAYQSMELNDEAGVKATRFAAERLKDSAEEIRRRGEGGG